MRKSLNEEWQEIKKDIIKHLESGWSINMSFSKVRIHRGNRLFDICYSKDQEFKKELAKYRQNRKKGFVR